MQLIICIKQYVLLGIYVLKCVKRLCYFSYVTFCCLKRLVKNDPRNPFGCVSERAAYSLSCVVYFILIVYIEVKCYQIASIMAISAFFVTVRAGTAYRKI